MTLPRTYLDVLARVPSFGDESGFTFVRPDGSERHLGFRTLDAEIRARGRKLRGLGLAAGDRLALVIPEPDEFVLTFLGAVSAGIVAVPLYPPLALGKLDAYVDSTARILEAAAADLLVTTRQVERVLWSVVGRVATLRDLVTVDKMAAAPEVDAPPPALGPDDPVFLQFTSGSTAAPKGVIVTQRSLVANTHAIIHDGLRAHPAADKGISWLPLYHDMGLIGFVLAPLVNGIPIVYIPTLQFVKRPALWLDVIHRHRGTMTFAPNFAFARVTKRATAADLARWDLSCLRVVGCGAEPIHPGTMNAFADKFAACGFKPESLLPCYGMAEATLAMTFVGLDERIRVHRVAPHEPELVACGRPFPGHEIGIFDSGGRRLPEGQVGEIRFRGPSVAGGYFRNPEATRASFLADGWLRTGDLGYLDGGQLYVSGRHKDILIVHGRNYYPQAVEWVLEDVPGIRKGNVVAFSVPGAETEEVVVVAETAELDAEKRAALAHRAKTHLNTQLQLVARDVVLLGVGQLPKTTSGKLQRRKTREQYLAGSLGREGVRTVGGTGERLQVARHLVMSFAARVTHRAQAFFRRFGAKEAR